MLLQISNLVLVKSGIHGSFFFFQAEDGIRDLTVTGVQTCALPISNTHTASVQGRPAAAMDSDGDFVLTWTSNGQDGGADGINRSEEHTSELQSQPNLVCRLLLEKKNNYLGTLSPQFSLDVAISVAP